MAITQSRLNFLTGFKNSPQGANEDPTYLGFKIIFDIDGVLGVGADDGLPPSPLFRNSAYLFDTGGAEMANNKPFGEPSYQSGIAFHSAQSYLLKREKTMNNLLGGKRADALNLFKELLRQINNQSPWFFQSITGLDKLAAVTKPGYNGSALGLEGGSLFDSMRTHNKSLTFNCLESLNLRVSTLAELYRQATFDFEYMRELVPRNLRKFKMFIYVSEIRNFTKTDRLTAVSSSLKSLGGTTNLLTNGMNPGNSSAQSNLNNPMNLGSSNSGGAAQNALVSGILNKSGLSSDTAGLMNFGNQTEQAGITPYIIFECSQCEFDFDSTTPINTELDNGTANATPVDASFKVYVGKVRTKIQVPNIRNDNDFLVLADNFELNNSSVKKENKEITSKASPTNGKDKTGFVGSLLSAGQNSLTNFVGNSINNFVNTQVANLSQALSGLNSALLGNVYSFNPGAALSTPSFNNISDLAQQFNNGLDLRGVISNATKLPNPQTTGLGGPPQRTYGKPTGDKYANVPGKDLGVPGRVYPKPSGDAYPNVPGKDLGVPQRIYPFNKEDVYKDSPGKDLGVPGRVYPKPVGDFYPDVPGKDLGAPDRVYPKDTGDVYSTVPGKDLGVPDRIYPAPNEDAYRTNPGRDLGVPDRVYQKPLGDFYPDVPGKDLGVPDRVYPFQKNDVYPTSPGKDLGVPDRAYGLESTKVYSDIPADAGVSQLDKVYTEQTPQKTDLNEKLYKAVESSNSFQTPSGNLYGINKPDYNTGNLGMVYKPGLADFKPEVQSLGNLKPADKYNISLDDVNGINEV